MIFHHVGLFVPDLATGREKLAAMIPIASVSAAVDDPGLKVRVQLCTDASGVTYELVAPFGEGNPVTGVIENGRAILNHVAYTVSDLAAESERLRQGGAVPLGPARPAEAFDGAPVAFFLTPLRFIIELIEQPVHDQ